MEGLELKIPGRPVPYVRTTQKQKYVSKQWKRYETYKAVVQLTFLIHQLSSPLMFTQKQKLITTTYLRESLTAYRDLLIEMINKSEAQAKEEYTIVKIELI